MKRICHVKVLWVLINDKHFSKTMSQSEFDYGLFTKITVNNWRSRLFTNLIQTKIGILLALTNKYSNLKAMSLHKEWSFSIKDFFSKCDQIHRKTSDLVTFTAEILYEKLHFLCSVCYIKPNFFSRERTPYKIPGICHCGTKYVTMEWIELNWLRKHMEKVRSRKAFILNKFL